MGRDVAPKAVLVVDDNHAILHTLVTTLGAEGIATFAASNGRDAVETFRDHAAKIDVVLLDYLMPGMNGLDVLAALRQMQADVSVILSTGVELSQDDLDRDLGVTVLKKPYTRSDLRNALAACTFNREDHTE